MKESKNFGSKKNFYTRTEAHIDESRNKKEAFKDALRKLFERGVTPQTITNFDVARILNIEIPKKLNQDASNKLTEQISNRLRPLFGSIAKPPEVIRFQCKLYLESKQSP